MAEIYSDKMYDGNNTWPAPGSGHNILMFQIRRSRSQGRAQRQCNGRSGIVSHEQLFRQEKHWQAIQFPGDFGRERFVSAYPGQASEQVDAVGCATKLDHLVGFKEVPRVQRRCVETEISENRFEPGRISSGWTNKNVEVSRVTRSCMKGDTVRADDDVFNAVGV